MLQDSSANDAETRPSDAPSGTDSPPAETASEPTTEADLTAELVDNLGDLNTWLPDSLQPAWLFLKDYPVIRAVLIVILGWFAAKLIWMFVRSTITRVTSRTRTTLDDQLIQLLARPVFVTLFYAFLAVAVISLPISDTATRTLIRILASLAVLMWLNAAFPISRLLLGSLSNLRNRYQFVQERTLPLLNMVTNLVLIAAGSYILLAIWKIDATAWLASAGVIGIAVGFAAKDSLANLFSGVFIVVDTPYKVGDYINLDSGERGMVTHVGMRSTRLLTRDDIEVTIPNAVIANAKISNESGGRWEKRRLRIAVGAAYGSDLDQVVEVLMAVAAGHEAVCEDPPARVRLRGFGASSLDFELLVWVLHPELRGKITHELLMQVYKSFNEAGIEIPYSKHDLYIKEMPQTDED